VTRQSLPTCSFIPAVTEEGKETMSLVLGTILLVIGVTAVVGIAAYVVDRSMVREERKDNA
jgi:hypothetical protein